MRVLYGSLPEVINRPRLSRSFNTPSSDGITLSGQRLEHQDLSERKSRRLLVDYPRAVPVGIFLLVMAIAILSVFVIERAESQRELSSMRETGQAVASALERRAASSSSYLRAGAALLSTTDRVDPGLFGSFVDELRLDSDFRGSDGIGWARAITPDELPSYRAEMASFGVALEAIRPRPDAATRRIVPVTYLQPATQRNLRAIGYDMYSEPTRRAAMDESMRTVSPTATGRIVLLQEGEGKAPGFLIYMPVFQGAGMERRLRGFIYSPFNAQQFLDSALELETRGRMGVKLYDGAVLPDRLLAELPSEFSSGRTLIEDVTVANRPMLLVVESAKNASLSLISMLTLLFGLAVGSLLMLVARLMTQQALEDRAALDWLEEQHSIRNTLTRELNHRVKNTLANVLSIAALTRRRATNVDEYAEGLEGRIRALSATHDLLTQSEWGTTRVRQIVDAELLPYQHGSSDAIVCSGPNVAVAPNDALSLGLALHELATNAVKYGALSQAGGQVQVHWKKVGDDLIELLWQESGGPEVSQPSSRGFGTDLLEKIVAHELKHPVELVFAPQGVSCKLLIPLRRRSAFAIRARPEQASRPG